MTYPPEHPEPNQQPDVPQHAAESIPGQPTTQPKRGRVGLVVAGAVGLVLGIAIGGAAVAFALRPDPPAANPAANSDRQQVLTACREAVKDRLKSPATAQFSREEVASSNVWVRGKVDSQNGFGALVRGSFECYLTNNGGPWQITSVNVVSGN